MELTFKGREFVHNHHLTVPFRPLEMHPEKGVGEPRLDGNLVVHGDNLHALKALLPMYAGKVDCVFIDPPYNTGNEGWAYNDNVNSPMIQEWLGKDVGVEDGLRHDKWACMMWPGLKLLHELLSDSGSLWLTIDDNELHHAKSILDEIFGARSFLGLLIRRTKAGGGSAADHFAVEQDYLLAYSKRPESFPKLFIPHDPDYLKRYSTSDEDGPYYWDTFVRNGTKTEPYVILAPDGESLSRRWFMAESEHKRLEEKGDVRFIRKENGEWSVQFKQRLSKGRKLRSIMYDTGYISDRNEIEVLGLTFDHPPKPVRLITTILEAIDNKNAIVLDSFAGSATTAHGVLTSNSRDSGNRRFILVECEPYADTLTAERVRRVVAGYPFKGTQREELLREPLTFTKLRNAEDLLAEVARVEALDGPRFDRLKKEVKDGALIVTGERDVAETALGLGGAFTYCTLGEPVEMDAILSGAALPDADAFAGLLWHTATATPLAQGAVSPAPEVGEGVARLGVHAGRTFWLIYKKDVDWLKSAAAALSLDRARAIAAAEPGPHLVFAPAKFVSRELLAAEHLAVEYAPLPFALFRLETA